MSEKQAAQFPLTSFDKAQSLRPPGFRALVHRLIERYDLCVK